MPTVFIPFLNVHFCGELLTTYGTTASLGNDRSLTVCSRTSKEFCDSFTAYIEMPPERAVLKRVVVRWINIVTLAGVVYMTVVERSVTGALKRHTIRTTHLRIKGRGKIYTPYRSKIYVASVEHESMKRACKRCYIPARLRTRPLSI